MLLRASSIALHSVYYLFAISLTDSQPIFSSLHESCQVLRNAAGSIILPPFKPLPSKLTV